MGDILKEAIADAKAVRETALQNAKMALEEAFTPQLKSMLSAKLKEDEDEVEEDLDLEAVIKELESELSEGEDDDEDTVDEQDDAYDEKASPGRDGLAEEDDAYDEKASPSRDGLAEGEDDDDKVEEEYEITLEGEDDEELDEVDKSSGVGSGDNSVADTDKSSGVGSGDNSLKEQLKEYKEAVKFLKDKLHEVNILNAKLLFTNKLFKSYSLDNNQKLKVVETFDRAQTTREIKLVYSTLAEQFNDNGSIVTRKSIKESASSAVGSTRPSKGSRKVISEETQVANRFKKLAGLIK